MSKVTLYSFGCIEIDARDDCIVLSQLGSEGGEQEVAVARDQLPTLIRLLQGVEERGRADG